MRLPPRQSTAEADLMVPFQQVTFSDCHNWQRKIFLIVPSSQFTMKYFSMSSCK